MKRLILFLFVLLTGLLNAQDTVFSFNSLPVPDTGFCNGSNLNGFFADTAAGVIVKLYNNYNASWNSWQGFAYSLWKDDSTAGYTNQWSAYPGYLLDSTFVIAYIGIDWNNNYQNIPAGMHFSASVNIKSVYLANTTYTALTIKNGNQYARSFADSDYYKVIITGYHRGEQTGQVEHYLADYRDGLRFIQKDWAFVDLSPIGTVDSISFNVMSTDTGDYGMNTPGYFALDRLRFSPTQPSTAAVATVQTNVKIYPNPADTYVILPDNIAKAVIFNQMGQKILQTRHSSVNVASLPAGLYVIRMWNGRQWIDKKLIIKH